ncbi:uncharacterized protein LOC131009081 [Salvia miltiorrhiza]|uniref:uncharacterized protein LOC131009081 n=1 Tax=Salvia miltiorrhiza TaxID=226208 RepID=UPI0025AC4E38|nr:uncharacterized protein LOC131009081 [Salvia miltiorrhiza]
MLADRPCLTLSSSFRQRQIKTFQFSLHGRMFLKKGEAPRFAADLFAELSAVWKPNSAWEVIPLGKGYFTLKFTSPEDFAVAFSKSAWRLRVGILFLQAWTPNFNPNKLESSTTQVWVRIFNLPHEFWHPEVLVGIAKHVGTPLLVDGLSARALVGYFARVLVEMNLALPIPDSIDVQCDEDIFEIEFKYEDLPSFCRLCSTLGHSTESCSSETDVGPSCPTQPAEQKGGRRGRRRRARSRRRRARSRTVVQALSLDPPEDGEVTKDLPVASSGTKENNPHDSKEDTTVMEVSDSPVDEEIIADDREAVCPAARSQRGDEDGSEVIMRSVVVPSTDMADDSAARLVIEPTHSAQEELASRISRLEEQVS